MGTAEPALSLPPPSRRDAEGSPTPCFPHLGWTPASCLMEPAVPDRLGLDPSGGRVLLVSLVPSPAPRVGPNLLAKTLQMCGWYPSVALTHLLTPPVPTAGGWGRKNVAREAQARVRSLRQVPSRFATPRPPLPGQPRGAGLGEGRDCSSKSRG